MQYIMYYTLITYNNFEKFHDNLASKSIVEQSSSYMRQGKFFEAYGLLKNQYKLGPEIHFARVLVKYYVTLMQTGSVEKADQIRDELIALLEERFSNSSDEICRYANRLLGKDKDIEAFLFYQVGWHFVKKNSNLFVVKHASSCCAVGTKASAINLFHGTTMTKSIIKDHIAAWIRTISDNLGDAPCFEDKKTSSLAQARCLKLLGECHGAFCDFDQAAALLNEAFNLIKRHHDKNAENHLLFASILKTLGFTYITLKRPRQAVKVLPRAIAAFKRAKDCPNIDQKNSLIAEAESGLKMAREMIRSQS